MLKTSKYTETHIAVTFDDDTVHKLWLQANGRMRQQLSASTGVLPIQQSKPTVMVVFVEVWDDIQNAPEPKIVTDEGIEAKFTRWDIQFKGNESKGIPGRWSGRILVSQTAQEIANNAKLTLQFKDSEKVVIGLYTEPEAGDLINDDAGDERD